MLHMDSLGLAGIHKDLQGCTGNAWIHMYLHIHIDSQGFVGMH